MQSFCLFKCQQFNTAALLVIYLFYMYGVFKFDHTISILNLMRTNHTYFILT